MDQYHEVFFTWFSSNTFLLTRLCFFLRYLAWVWESIGSLSIHSFTYFLIFFAVINNSLQGCQLEAVFIDIHDVRWDLASFKTGHSTAGKLRCACTNRTFLGIALWHAYHIQTRTSSFLFVSFHFTTVSLSSLLQCPRGFFV